MLSSFMKRAHLTNLQTQNPCIRCGKERIVSKTWTDKLELGIIGRMMIVTHSDSACPDTACQTIVDRQLTEKRRKKEEATNRPH